MKKYFLLTTALSIAFFIQAQQYETAKKLAGLTSYKKAKEEVDKGMINAEYAAKPEAHILKALIYASLAIDSKPAGNDEAVKLLFDADAAYRKYKEMDPALTLVTDITYQTGVLNLYSAYYTFGYNDYTAKKWDAAFEKFKKAAEYSDMMMNKKILAVQIDTNVLILAGLVAEKSNHKDDAAKYYSRLADIKITGEDFESVYRFLVNYYFVKNDMTGFEKYKALGKMLYPQSEFFSFDKIDFAAGLETELFAKIKALEKILVTDPGNFKANEVLGEIIYDTLNPKDEHLLQPANADELEKKMVTAFTKAAAAKPGYENPFIYMGDHFINKAVNTDKERTAFTTEVKARTKPGTAASEEDITKKNALNRKYGNALEMALDPYEKAAAIFAKKTQLTVKDKQQYKKVAGYLADIYAYKKVMSLLNPDDTAKFAAEEKKWNSLLESIK